MLSHTSGVTYTPSTPVSCEEGSAFQGAQSLTDAKYVPFRPGLKKVSILIKVWNVNKSRPWRRRAAIFRKLRSACVEVGTHRRKSTCVEVGSTHKHLRRGVNSNNFNYITCEEVKSVESKFFLQLLDTSYVRATREPEKKKGRIFPYFSKMYKNALREDLIRVVENLDSTVESTDTIANLKTKIENSSTFESEPDFVKTLIQNCIDERVSRNEREVTLEKQKIELTKLQLAQLEKEVELQRAKNKALSLNPAAKDEEKQFETLNKETATHIGIREAEDWFRPIDLAKECDIYISSRSGSHKEIPITYGYTQDPFKNRSQNFKPEIKENYPQNLERENKNCFICGDSSHCARDCEKRFKPKESNDHIHNRINVITLKIESEKQNSDEFANLQYVNIFVENQPVTALIDSGCQIPVLNSSLIRVQTPSEEIITLSSCFGEQRMVEVKPINLSLNQHSPGLSVRTAISPTLTEEIIIHPSVYSEIKELGHAKSDVLLNESESSLGAHAYAYPNVVSVSNVIKNSSYDLTHVKNFNIRNDLSSLIKNYKPNKNSPLVSMERKKGRRTAADSVHCQVIYSQFGLAIHQNDHQARRRFVEWVQKEIAVVPDFHKRILFRDEAHFWLNAYVNKQNCRLWSEANPQVYVETPLHPEKVTVWCALWAGGILLQKR
ncbi:hypothetical protein TNCV_4606891 [Trichonephila clavipes]|nr:hypothetical protein TNCV_4606891 [Trichonephila clavipes]